MLGLYSIMMRKKCPRFLSVGWCPPSMRLLRLRCFQRPAAFREDPIERKIMMICKNVYSKNVHHVGQNAFLVVAVPKAENDEKAKGSRFSRLIPQPRTHALLSLSLCS
jgi:hypothetical protein